MARNSDGTTATERTQTDPTPDTRCDECSTTWNQSAEGRKCPQCGGDGRLRRSEPADFGGGESTGIDEL